MKYKTFVYRGAPNRRQRKLWKMYQRHVMPLLEKALVGIDEVVKRQLEERAL